jgi:ribokinase
MVEPTNRPVFIGTVAVDVLHTGLAGDDLPTVSLRWGGVTSNMACAAGTLGADPLFVSVAYAGEFRWAVSNHLTTNAVTWLPLPVTTNLPFFYARTTPSGNVAEEMFIGEAALTALTPALLAPWQDIIINSSAVVTCTDVGALRFGFSHRH